MYAPPEVLKMENYDTAADMWSLGVLIFYCLFGHFPVPENVKDDALVQYVEQVQRTHHRTPFWKTVDPEARDFIDKLLVTNSTDRIRGEAALVHHWVSPGESKALCLSSAIPY